MNKNTPPLADWEKELLMPIRRGTRTRQVRPNRRPRRNYANAFLTYDKAPKNPRKAIVWHEYQISQARHTITHTGRYSSSEQDAIRIRRARASITEHRAALRELRAKLTSVNP